MTHGVGTTCWLAPELIKDAKGSELGSVSTHRDTFREFGT